MRFCFSPWPAPKPWYLNLILLALGAWQAHVSAWAETFLPVWTWYTLGPFLFCLLLSWNLPPHSGSPLSFLPILHPIVSAAMPKLFDIRDQFSGRQLFHRLEAGDGLVMIQAHFIYCALYYYYYISSTSDHQALEPRGWGPLPQCLPLMLLPLVSRDKPPGVICSMCLPHPWVLPGGEACVPDTLPDVACHITAGWAVFAKLQNSLHGVWAWVLDGDFFFLNFDVNALPHPSTQGVRGTYSNTHHLTLYI